MSIQSKTWWIDSANRTWLILGVPMQMFFDGNGMLDFVATGVVELIQLGKNEPIEQPYTVIDKLIGSGEFKPLNL